MIADTNGQTQKPGLVNRAARFLFGYDAAEASTRRATPDQNLKHEDWFLRGTRQRQILAASRDITRKHTLLQWAIRKHCDYVTHHSINFTTPDTALNNELEDWFAERSKAENFDIRGVHDRHRWFRQAEARKILDGDVVGVKLASRHLQAIEADRIRDPDATYQQRQHDRWYNGVKTNAAGRKTFLSIWGRNEVGTPAFERTVSIDRVIWMAWHDSHFRFDSVRGVGPLTAAINDFIDIHEVKIHGIGKQKIAQYLAFVIKSQLDAPGEYKAQTTQSDDMYQFWSDLGQGPTQFNLEPGEDVEMIEPKTGTDDLIELLDWCSEYAIRALDLPVQLLDQKGTNFHGSKAAMGDYKQSLRHKQKDVEASQREWCEWQMDMGSALGEMPTSSQYSADELKKYLQLSVPGTPFLDLAREIPPTVEALREGLITPTMFFAERFGTTLDDMLDLQESDRQKYDERGLPYPGSAAPAQASPFADDLENEDDDDDDETEDDQVSDDGSEEPEAND